MIFRSLFAIVARNKICGDVVDADDNHADDDDDDDAGVDDEDARCVSPSRIVFA